MENKENPLLGVNILVVVLSFRWGSIERTALKDGLLAKEMGANVFIYCFKGSLLDKRAKFNNIKTYHHDGKIYTKFFQWNKLKAVKRVLQDYQINLVHCYDIRMLWPISYFLISRPLVPLVFTQGFDLKKFYKRFWHRPLRSRIDRVFLPMLGLEDNVWGHLGVPLRKVQFIGLGCHFDNYKDISKPPFRFTEERWYIGTNLTGIETNTHFLDTLFHAFNVMLEKKLEKKSYTLVLALERSWADFNLNDELKRQVKDMGLEEHVAFVGPIEMEEVQRHVDIWIGQSRREDLEDYSVEAMLNGCPVIVPRSSASMETLRELGELGETYKRDDSRELREKCEKVLKNLEHYRRNLDSCKEELKTLFGHSNYKKELIKSYRKLIRKRDRLEKQKYYRLKMKK